MNEALSIILFSIDGALPPWGLAGLFAGGAHIDRHVGGLPKVFGDGLLLGMVVRHHLHENGNPFFFDKVIIASKSPHSLIAVLIVLGNEGIVFIC